MREVFKMKKFVVSAILCGIAIAYVSNPAQAATPKISASVKNQLVYLIQEEKLARDVYNALAANGASQKFSNITPSEQAHMDALALILKTYGIANPTIGLKAGSFKDAKLTSLYKSVMAKAVKSPADAIAVGILIEKTDIADLKKLIKLVTQDDIIAALNLLLSGSEKHLAAFSR